MKALRLAALLALGFCGVSQAQNAKPVRITVDEGTSMSVAASPDGKSLAMDLQGSIWVLPAAGGEAHRVTDLFNDARQPAWTADGKSIVFFAYRDGGYHLWSVSPDGTGQRQITRGMFDEREPAVSHDGTHIAFSSDRGNPLGSDYNIFVQDLRSGEVRQLLPTLVRIEINALQVKEVAAHRTLLCQKGGSTRGRCLSGAGGHTWPAMPVT
jgi:Tol biopolymer transport system component